MGRVGDLRSPLLVFSISLGVPYGGSLCGLFCVRSTLVGGYSIFVKTLDVALEAGFGGPVVDFYDARVVEIDEFLYQMLSCLGLMAGSVVKGTRQ